jgi:lysylphosphatidylglycerol synthetase-like protein (DUF2156 family)
VKGCGIGRIGMASVRLWLDERLERRAAAIPTVGLTADDRLALVRAHGDFSLAYSTAAQKDLSYFGDREGYIAFGYKMTGVFALGDPVAPSAVRSRLIRDFVHAAGAPTFVQVGEETARTLSALGYRVNRMGVDTRIALSAAMFSGRRNETVRYSERWLVKNGYRLVEDDGACNLTAELQALSKRWRAGRVVKSREMSFLNRPFSAVPGPGMRRFLLISPQGEALALLDLDPIHRDGETVGYTTSFKRKLPGVTPHAEIGLTKFAADRLFAEGRRELTLGLSPLVDVGPSGFRESPLLRTAMQRLFHSPTVNRRIFNLEGQAAFKRRFHGAEEPVYIAFRRLSPVRMIALLRLCRAL